MEWADNNTPVFSNGHCVVLENSRIGMGGGGLLYWPSPPPSRGATPPPPGWFVGKQGRIVHRSGLNNENNKI